MEQTWHDLLFAHWPIAPDKLRPLVPARLSLETFDGQCWVAVAPFHMTGVRARWTPALPGVSAFPELNVRTYVSYEGKPGVYFFSLDAGSRLAAMAARLTYHLPYFHSDMKVADTNSWIEYSCVRGNKWEFCGRYKPIAPVERRRPGTLPNWLSERYCLYAVARDAIYRAEIHHEQWPLQDAEAEISSNTMAGAAGIELPNIKPLLHFSRKLQVLIWPLKKV